MDFELTGINYDAEHWVCEPCNNSDGDYRLTNKNTSRTYIILGNVISINQTDPCSFLVYRQIGENLYQITHEFYGDRNGVFYIYVQNFREVEILNDDILSFDKGKCKYSIKRQKLVEKKLPKSILAMY